MTNNTSVLVIEPKKSMLLNVVILGSHIVVVLVTLFLLQGHWLIQVSVLLLIGFSAYYYSRLHITKVLNRSVKMASHHIGKGWLIIVPSKQSKNKKHVLKHVLMDEVLEEQAMDLEESSYVSQWWVILNFRSPENRKRYTLLVPADSVSTEVHRQLRVRLKTMI